MVFNSESAFIMGIGTDGFAIWLTGPVAHIKIKNVLHASADPHVTKI